MPGYNKGIAKLFDITDAQYDSFILGDFELPSVTNEAGYVVGWKPFFNSTTGLFIWCVQGSFVCYWSLFVQGDDVVDGTDWMLQRSSNQLYVQSDRGFRPMGGEDPRLILHPSKKRVFIVLNHRHPNSGLKTSFLGELTYDPNDGALYLPYHPFHLDIMTRRNGVHFSTAVPHPVLKLTLKPEVKVKTIISSISYIPRIHTASSPRT